MDVEKRRANMLRLEKCCKLCLGEQSFALLNYETQDNGLTEHRGSEDGVYFWSRLIDLL